MSEDPQKFYYVSPSLCRVGSAIDGSRVLAVELYFSERERLFLKLPDQHGIGLLLSPEEALKIGRELQQKALLMLNTPPRQKKP